MKQSKYIILFFTGFICLLAACKNLQTATESELPSTQKSDTSKVKVTRTPAPFDSKPLPVE